jgi:hypothetical protein
MDAPVRITTPLARELLRKRYPSPEWALMDEVAPSTGGGTGYADAVAVNLWRSGGHAVHGHEIKVSRSDWLRELKQPGKADPVMAYCDFWWLVCPKDVADESEIPLTWGWMVPQSNGFRIARKAPRLQPKPLDRAFFASIVRRGFEASESIARGLVADEMNRVRQTSQKAIDDGIAAGTRHIREEIESLRAQLVELKQHTGIEIGRYSSIDIGVLKLAQSLHRLNGYGDKVMFSRLLAMADGLEKAAAQVRKACAESDPEAPPAAEVPAPTQRHRDQQNA